jgi:hypothetical protein
MTRLALFYYAGKKITPKEQIAEFIKYFDGVVLLSTDEGKYSDFSTLLSDMKKFVAESGLGFEIWVEIPYYDATKTPRTLEDMKDWIIKVESSTVARRVTGYYFSLEGAGAVSSDSTKIKNIVSYIRDTYKKPVLWIPIERWEDRDPLYLTRKCVQKVGFTHVAPQPHYYMVTDTKGDYYRPNGMNYQDLNEFMWFCHENGFGVEMEWDSAVRGYCEHCGYGCNATKCTERARDYLVSLSDIEKRFGKFPYVVYYFSTDLNNYLKVVR